MIESYKKKTYTHVPWQYPLFLIAPFSSITEGHVSQYELSMVYILMEFKMYNGKIQCLPSGQMCPIFPEIIILKSFIKHTSQ